ncbi:MAG: hypothetical protein A2Y17_11055 [Clostridiales bacterium GWF2_38_85]|nr:MAG: hypothetical protein A2Y17_11055 [Clostridiales bacterium GWF2_38_85]HBL84665.1 hypothetical protein [Clostridiales bacterium]
MEFVDLLKKRTCIRSYENKPVSDIQMRKLLEAGVRAPNACNNQSWHFYAVCDKSIINKFHPDIAHISWIDNIPLLIVICIDEDIVDILQKKFGERGRMFSYQDTAGAANLILLKAVELGLGGCWIGPMDVEKCKALLPITKNHTPVAILTIGTPAVEMPVRERKNLSDVVTVIGKLPTETSSEFQEVKQKKLFTLAHESLEDAVFEDLNLSNAEFNDINMQGARFGNINMSFTSYRGLTMSEAKFGCIDMAGAEFDGSDLRLAKFKNASFENVKITDCKLDGMTIDGINVKDMMTKIK